jgi:hypothetical protein
MSTTVNVSGGLLYIRQNASVVEHSTNGTTWSTINFPMTINNTNIAGGVVQVLFTTDITLASAIAFFICGTASIQFGSRTLKSDGSLPLITIDYSGAAYPGMVRNGTSISNGANNVSIVNLRVVGSASVLLGNGGWVAQDYFGKGASNNRIINCSSESAIQSSCGGIAGSYVGNSSGNVTILGCTSSGSIGNSAGGIVGAYGGSNGGTITISNCSSSGTIGTFSGGIAALYTGYGGTAIITNCFSTGSSIAGGGIVGSYGGYGGSLSVTNCYSTGSISANSAGIVADNAGTFSGSVIINKCYSTGTITASSSAGILGANSGTIFLTGCYTSGAAAGGTGGIRFNVSTDGAGNYSEGNNGSSGWNDSRAASVLGTGWISIATGTPYELSAFRYTPYTTTNIQANYTFQTSTSETIQAGNTTTTTGIASGFSLVNAPTGITINATSGLITASMLVNPGTYTLTTRTTSTYTISTFSLTVTAIPVPPVGPSSGRVASQSRFNENQQYITLVGGNPLLSERTANINAKIASYADYLRYRKAASQPR